MFSLAWPAAPSLATSSSVTVTPPAGICTVSKSAPPLTMSPKPRGERRSSPGPPSSVSRLVLPARSSLPPSPNAVRRVPLSTNARSFPAPACSTSRLLAASTRTKSFWLPLVTSTSLSVAEAHLKLPEALQLASRASAGIRRTPSSLVVVAADARAGPLDVGAVDVDRDRRRVADIADAVDVAGRREAAHVTGEVVALAQPPPRGVEQLLVLDALDDAEHAPRQVIVDSRDLPGAPDERDD